MSHATVLGLVHTNVFPCVFYGVQIGHGICILDFIVFTHKVVKEVFTKIKICI
jgi:hypothetical protein